jgi:hypothetical protein
MHAQGRTAVVGLAWVLPVAAVVAQSERGLILDVLDPSDAGYEPPPTNRYIVDIFVDVADDDLWTASGLRVTSTQYSSLVYATDNDPNTDASDLLRNPGYANRFCTSISRPRVNRNGLARFENGGATIAGAYMPTGFVPEVLPTLLNVAYFSLPTETDVLDGYIARLAFDVDPRAFDYRPPGADLQIAQHPVGMLAMLGRIERIPSEDSPGAAFATRNDPIIRGGDWYFYFGYVPEPGTLGVLLIGTIFIRLRSR